jgi:transcription elongation factor GreA
MRNELTKKDIELMQQELDHRRLVLRPQLIEAVKTARAFGDLSENFEYKAAKQEKNRNDSRCRYLENMIKSAVIVSDRSAEGVVGLYDKVTLYVEEDEEEMEVQVVTTMRQDALKGLISKESPVGKAIFGRKVGEKVSVQVNPSYSYDVVIRAIIPGQDDGEAPLRSF